MTCPFHMLYCNVMCILHDGHMMSVYVSLIGHKQMCNGGCNELMHKLMNLFISGMIRQNITHFECIFQQGEVI